MYFQVLQPGKALAADGTLVWFLVGVSADVDQHLVPTQETRGETGHRKTLAQTPTSTGVYVYGVKGKISMNCNSSKSNT